MKKTIAIWICMALVVSATTVTGYRMYQNSKPLTLVDANIEALSQSENIPGGACTLEGKDGPLESAYFCVPGTIVGGDIKPCPPSHEYRVAVNSKILWACHKIK